MIMMTRNRLQKSWSVDPCSLYCRLGYISFTVHQILEMYSKRNKSTASSQLLNVFIVRNSTESWKCILLLSFFLMLVFTNLCSCADQLFTVKLCRPLCPFRHNHRPQHNKAHKGWVSSPLLTRPCVNTHRGNNPGGSAMLRPTAEIRGVLPWRAFNL